MSMLFFLPSEPAPHPGGKSSLPGPARTWGSPGTKPVSLAEKKTRQWTLRWRRDIG